MLNEKILFRENPEDLVNDEEMEVEVLEKWYEQHRGDGQPSSGLGKAAISSPIKLGNVSQLTGRESGVITGPLIRMSVWLVEKLTHPRCISFRYIVYTTGKGGYFQYLFQFPQFTDRLQYAQIT